MLPFKLVYSDDYYLPLGAHVFPAVKYRMIHARLLETGVAEPADFVAPKPASDDEIRLGHTAEYVAKLRLGTLSAAEQIQLEVPYSRELVDAVWLAAGGSILAADLALAAGGVAMNIAGGFLHAFADHGVGFCLVNDVAVAIKCLHRRGRLNRALVVDLDVHDGNGTAGIFPPQAPLEPHRADGDLNVFTLSMHQAANYPLYKPPSSIDVNLPDRMRDHDYLSRLDDALGAALQRFDPQLICYLAGADPYEGDQLGGLTLTIDGLKARDARVFQAARTRQVAVMVTCAGGYARRVEDTVTIHCNTVIAARDVMVSARRGAYRTPPPGAVAGG